MHPLVLPVVPLRWLVFAHVASVVAFAIVHGGSVYAMLALRRERDVARVSALLEMSSLSLRGTFPTFAAMGATGLLLAAVEHTWRETWVWASIVVVVGMSVAMSLLATRPFNRLRHAAGLAWFNGVKQVPASPPDPEALAAELPKLRVGLVSAIGFAGFAVLLWLMVLRPG